MSHSKCVTYTKLVNCYTIDSINLFQFVDVRVCEQFDKRIAFNLL